jgi:hypothetical protein
MAELTVIDELDGGPALPHDHVRHGRVQLAAVCRFVGEFPAARLLSPIRSWGVGKLPAWLVGILSGISSLR